MQLLESSQVLVLIMEQISTIYIPSMRKRQNITLLYNHANLCHFLEHFHHLYPKIHKSSTIHICKQRSTYGDILRSFLQEHDTRGIYVLNIIVHDIHLNERYYGIFCRYFNGKKDIVYLRLVKLFHSQETDNGKDFLKQRPQHSNFFFLFFPSFFDQTTIVNPHHLAIFHNPNLDI